MRKSTLTTLKSAEDQLEATMAWGETTRRESII